jgi:signal transduction histidine kinase
MPESGAAQLLVVDDDELSRGLTALHFSRSGYGVAQAANGADALALLAARPFSLVLLDIDMPQMDGIAVLTQIRRMKSVLELPVIMVTANAHEGSVVNALSHGANDYLVKPVNMQVALARVRTQLSLGELARLKDEFVAFASHDLKKPLMLQEDMLSTLSGSVSGPGTSAEVRELVELVRRTNTDMQAVVRGFLDSSLRGSTNAASMASELVPEQLIGAVVQANRDYAARKKVDLRIVAPQPLPTLRADGFRLRQVLENLVGNAIKFSPPDTLTEVRASADDDFVTIEVVDRGPGLTDEDRRRLFTKGARLSNKPTGGEESTGVGLALCKEILQQVGGEIGARNNPGAGATFWLRLPRNL